MQDVIVFSINYLITLGVIRSLGEAGYQVKLLSPDRCSTLKIAGSSKYVKKSLFVDFTPEKIVEGLEALRENEEKPLVIALNDRCCMLLDECYETLSSHFILANVGEKPGALADFMDKVKQKRLARECGLLTAEGSAYSTDPDGVMQAIKEAKYPCFIKPPVSALLDHSKSSFAICHNEDELKDAMLMVKEKGCRTVLLEEFLNITKELCIYGVAAKGKVYAPVLTETIRGGFDLHKGVTIEGYARSANEIPDVKEKIMELVKRIQYTGLFCVDLLQCGDKIYFSEINLRGGGSGYAATLAGANLTAALADIVYNNATTQKIDDITREVRFLNERIEYDTYKLGFISRQEYRDHLAGKSERFLESTVDPKPWRLFQRRIHVSMLKKKLRRYIPSSLLQRYENRHRK